MKRRNNPDKYNGFGDAGGYMTAKINKLEEQFTSLQNVIEKKSDLFSGVSIHVNGWTNPTASELKQIMIENGGTFHHYERKHTKYVIASNLPDVKIRTNITRNIVKPEWIVDCLKENRLLDVSNYLLHTKRNTAQPQINFQQKAEPKTEEEVLEINLSALDSKIKSKGSLVKEEGEKTGTAVDENFLQEFLANSRLHHIATLGSGFKYYISDLRKNHNGEFPEREKLKANLKRVDTTYDDSESIIMHIDMDCFFVSVGLKKYPHLKGQPIAVTHSKGKSDNEDFISMSEIASCSYECREKGIKNGMFVGQALKLVPELKTIPYDFEGYRSTAYTLYNTVAKYTLDIEAVSCDELYADLKSLIDECKIDVMDFVSYLRNEIFEATQCTCSVGIGANRLQARLATKQAKPNGQFELLTADIIDFMKDKKISDLPGVGFSTHINLENLGLKTCDQIQQMSLQFMQNNFGKKFGESLLQMSKGIDDKKLNYEQVRKSVSVDVNYGIRFNDNEEVRRFLLQICEELSKRLKEINKKGSCLTLKIMMRAKEASAETRKFMGHGEVDKLSKSVQLIASTDDPVTLHISAMKLLNTLNIPPYELRGIGLQISKLDEERKEGGKLMEMFKKMSEKQDCKKHSSNEVAKAKIIFPEEQKLTVAKKNISTRKKRGRPSKLTTSNQSTNSIANMFAAKKPTSRLKYIDPDVLAELPPDIVEEVLRDYELEAEEANSTKRTIEKEVPQEEECERVENNFFINEEWRAKIKSWIDENSKPSEEMIRVLNNDLTQLVRVRHLELLHVIMRFLHRVIRDDGKKDWKSSYQNDFYFWVQEEMKKCFRNRRLSIPYDFK